MNTGPASNAHAHVTQGKKSSESGGHTHVVDLSAQDAAIDGIDGALAAMGKRVAALEARVTAVESTPPVIVPGPDPVPQPAPFPWASLQAAIDATAAGGTIDCTGRLFTETVNFRKPQTFIGGRIDGGKQRTVWADVTAPDVFLDGMSFVNAALSASQDNRFGSLNIAAPRFHWRNGTAVSGCYAAIRPWVGGTDAFIENCDVSGAPINLVAWQADGLRIIGGRFHHATGTPDLGNESGGMKIGKTLRAVVDGVEIDHNVGLGGWYDVLCSGGKFLNVKAHDNKLAGLMVEMQDGFSIRGCTVNRNALGNPGNAYERNGGIFISSDRNGDVTGNLVAFNGYGTTGPVASDITIIAQSSVHPETAPYDLISATGNVLSKAPAYYGYPAVGPVPIIVPNTVDPNDARLAGLK